MTAEEHGKSHAATEHYAKKLYTWAALLALAIATLCLYLPHYPSTATLEVPGVESFALAESLVAHHGFSDPFWAEPTGPTAHLGPLYPAYLALIIRIFGHGSRAVGALMWAASVTLAVQLMMLPLLARRFGLSFWTGYLASIAWLAAGIAPTFLSEAGFIAVLVAAAAFFMRKSFSEELSTTRLMASGVVWGALLLLQPVVLIIIPAWLLLLHFRSQRTLRQKLALAVFPLLLVAPWTIRNVVVMHAPILVRDNLGIELAVSNNSCASYSMKINFDDGCFLRKHPNQSYEEAHKVVQLGEIEYNRRQMQQAIGWIRTNPQAFFSLSAQRFQAFWVPKPDVLTNRFDVVILRPSLIYVFTVLAIPGMFLMWRNNRSSAYVVGLWLLLYPLIYYVVQYIARYRYPILWGTFIPGSYFLAEVLRGLLRSGQIQEQAKAGCLEPEEI